MLKDVLNLELTNVDMQKCRVHSHIVGHGCGGGSASGTCSGTCS